jgi:hypothetical protein
MFQILIICQKTQFLHKPPEEVFASAAQKRRQPSSLGGIEFVYLRGLLPAGENPKNENWAWGYSQFKVKRIAGLDQSICLIIALLDQEAQFIRVISFSTRAVLTAVVASLLEQQHSCNMFPIQVGQ